MYPVLISIHILICFLVVLVVLIQSGRGAGFSGLFGGGGGGDALFSAPSGSSFIRKLTAGLAVAFFVSSLALTYLSATRGLRTVTRGAWPMGPEQGEPSAPPISAPKPEAKPTPKAAPAKPVKKDTTPPGAPRL